jgi:hypothetical protein
MIQDKFQQWLVESEKKKLSTAQAYCSAINQLSNHYTDFEHKIIDLFKVTDLDELNRIIELYDSNGKYSEIGEIGHRTYINAIKALSRFINNSPKHRGTRQTSSKSGIKIKLESVIDFDFDPVFKLEAAAMSKHYELFYCLERSIRNLIVQLMKEKYGVNWWEQRVKSEIKENVETNILREADTGYTKRSGSKIDYTTFGELRQIVKFNWDAFSNSFTSLNAFNNIMITLNTLRVPIAHCTPFAEDEVTRLHLTVKDWFRLINS